MSTNLEVVADRFRLLGPIARGNMGEVHRATDMQAETDAAHRVVAVKLVLRHRTDNDPGLRAAERFRREVRIAGRLDHPNVPHVVAGGVDDEGLAYLAMEYIDGRPLDNLIAECPQVPVSWVAAIGAQIANGLAAAHAAGVIHRDVKPANVMVAHGGVVKVLDFGMGRIADDVTATQLTSTGVTVGTARYMAPEQFGTSTVTPAADLYALGCVLYELLTGVPPFDSDSGHELGEKHRNEPVPPVKPLRSDAPTELLRLIEGLLAKEPADRPVDAVTVRDTLQPLAVGGDVVHGWADFNPLNAASNGVSGSQIDASTRGDRSHGASGMDIFDVQRALIDDYRAFTESGTVIRDPRIAEFVTNDLDSKSQWPDPWVSLNPFFESGGSVDDLAKEGTLHQECARIFQSGKSAGSALCDGRPLTLHQHQREAIDVARSGESYVLTTGTGSGKSLAYIVPIVDKVLRSRPDDGTKAANRVRAIVVYPMNALANSQLGELEKFLQHGYGAGHEPVTFARYTGQESDERRKEIRDNPPDILLTNYVMLELMLTRPDDRRSLITMASGLEFLVLDELHTYRGRQGADVAMLIRRVRDACQAENLQCVGTSATMSSEGTFNDQRTVVAGVASRLFGTTVQPGNVIGETLVRATEATADVPVERLKEPDPPQAYHDLVSDPLARWIETRFGLTTEEGTGRLVRQKPGRIEVAAAELALESGLTEGDCAKSIRQTLKAGAQARHPDTDRPLFAFRLHQFLSKGDTVYVTLDDPTTRYLTRDYQRVQPGSDGKVLLPLAFCRECGQEYLTVWRTQKDGRVVYEPRQDTSATGGREGDGYLHIDSERTWPRRTEEAIADRRLPESWLQLDDHGGETVRDSYRKRLPSAVTVDPYGNEEAGELNATFIPAPFLFCLHCQVSYEQVRGRDFARLARLDHEGRSSATSLVSSSIVRSLKQAPTDALTVEARKLLTFVDNRQDASLQAGHFNDFVQVTQLRAALHQATRNAGNDGIRHEELASRVADELGLDVADYTGTNDLAPSLARNAAATLRDVIAFRLYLDLQGGWRVTMPNLEQTGLLTIDYEDLGWLAENEGRWSGRRQELRDAVPGRRVEIMSALLDEMRRALAVEVQYFRDDFDRLQLASEERLIDPWVLSTNDRPQVGTAYPQGSKPGMDRSGLFLSGRGKFGKYLRRVHFDMTTDDAQDVITDLLEVLAEAQLVDKVQTVPERARRSRRPSGPGITGYRIAARALIWRAGTGEMGTHDPLTRTYASGDGPRVNAFFRDLYQQVAGALGGLTAREHTAQVDPAERERREDAFRRGDLKLLYCSPTMELGVDISELNAVMMRNVPPTPANYAQRSGRAGRSGQPALVTTYCATGNSHDQYYFRRSDRMVAGAVAPPRLDLANEDLVRSHVYAIWLAELGLKLGRSIPELIDIGYDEDARVPNPRLPLHEHVTASLNDPVAQRRAATAAHAVIDGLLTDVGDTTWWHDQWIEDTVRTAGDTFDRSFDRWRDLFKAALVDQAEQNRRVLDHTLAEGGRQSAVGRRKEAETQLNLLKNETAEGRSVLSDFNPYRYLASEGFLPGYSFPRLPLAAYIPHSNRRFGDGDYLQRPRFLAIREFGPGALIYHEGSRYQVDRIQLPPASTGDVETTTAKRCAACGYHHDADENDDKCRMCGEPLREETTGLLRLHTVYTKRRERISSDEEERRRAGFRLVTSYRFRDHGARPGSRDAVVSDGDKTLATMIYGDSATVRVTNVGRSRATQDEPDGFWLDPVDGRWMNQREAAEASGDSSEMPTVDDKGEEKRRKIRVIPYVEDRRNVLVFQLADAIAEAEAKSLMYALERGIEAAFELEDSELTSELLPPDDGDRDRMLFTEAAEGGAGVLRLLQSEPSALSQAVGEALDICHFDADGTDRGGPHADRPCARGCYECLLTYGNQLDHGMLDRHSVRDLLLRLGSAGVAPAGRGESRTDQMERLIAESDTALEGRLVAFLKERGLRLPDEAQSFVAEALARPDYVYRLEGVNVAVFVDGPVHDDAVIAQRDADAQERLLDKGWDVVRFGYDDDWDGIVRRLERIFGRAAGA